MRKSFLNIITFTLMAVFISTAAYTAQAQIRAYRVTDRQVQTIISRIETRTDVFRTQLSSALDRSSLNGTQSEDMINSYVAGFETATDNLRNRFNSRQSESADVQEVLVRANFIENFIRQNRLNANVERQWVLVRNDLNLLANYYNVSWTWGGMVSTPYPGNNVPVYTATDVQLRDLLVRIENNTDVFKRQITRQLDRSTINGTRSEDSINGLITDFENSTDRLRQRFDARQSVAADAEAVLTQARLIDSFMRQSRLRANAETQWNLLRTDLNTLASYYRLSWNWNALVNPGSQYTGTLTGTYRLNSGQSDNVLNIINDSIRSNGAAQSDRIRRNLERRLTPPSTLILEQRNNQMTIASDLSQQVTFDVDGVRRTETNPNGRTVNIRTASVGNGVEVSYEGDRTNDFFLTFMPMNNGQLRVTRRVYLENQNQTVTVNTVYDKVSSIADFSRVNSNTTAQTYPNGTTTINNNFLVPNGTQLVASLTRGFSTNTANEGDRFTMEVRSPSQYDGAIIEGYVSNTQKSGRVSGRAQVTFNFDTIRLRNGETYRFSGLIDQVRQPNGETVSVNNEGAVRDSNQTTRTATRAGIGAAIGAIIGAIAGGGQGAAIGAGIGAGAGAGTVILQGRDNLELQTGSEFRITSSAPANLGTNY